MNNSGSVTTADDGNLLGRYQFINLAAGNYIVQVDSTNFSSGQPLNGLTLTNSAHHRTTSARSATRWRWAQRKSSGTPTLALRRSAIGDTVWQDNNGNGLQDAGEPGIQNVSVQLWRDTNNDGTRRHPGRHDDHDANGHYYFTGLPAGDYVVVIPASNFDSGQPLYNFTQTYDPDASTQPCSGGECDNQGKLVDTTSAIRPAAGPERLFARLWLPAAGHHRRHAVDQPQRQQHPRGRRVGHRERDRVAVHRHPWSPAATPCRPLPPT